MPSLRRLGRAAGGEAVVQMDRSCFVVCSQSASVCICWRTVLERAFATKYLVTVRGMGCVWEREERGAGGGSRHSFIEEQAAATLGCVYMVYVHLNRVSLCSFPFVIQVLAYWDCSLAWEASVFF